MLLEVPACRDLQGGGADFAPLPAQLSLALPMAAKKVMHCHILCLDRPLDRVHTVFGCTLCLVGSGLKAAPIAPLLSCYPQP